MTVQVPEIRVMQEGAEARDVPVLSDRFVAREKPA
jgi:hypothetical protein